MILRRGLQSFKRCARPLHTSSNQEFLDFLKAKAAEEQQAGQKEKPPTRRPSPVTPVETRPQPGSGVGGAKPSDSVSQRKEKETVAFFTTQDGFDVSSTSSDAPRLFDASLDTYLRLRGPLIKSLRDCLEADPGFVLGNCFMGCMTMLGGATTATSSNLSKLVDATAASLKTRHATHRETLHGNAFLSYSRGDIASSIRCYDRILEHWPNDLFALRMAHDIHFLTGDRARLFRAVESSLPHIDRSDKRRGYLHGMLAFGLEECGRYDEAEHYARQALDSDRKDAWAVHALAHVYEMTARPADGLEFLLATEKDWSDCNLFAPHIYWHSNLYRYRQGSHYVCGVPRDLKQDAATEILDVYTKHIRKLPGEWNESNPPLGMKGSMSPLDLTDATSALVRLVIAGVPVSKGRWDDLRQQWGQRASGFHGYLFNDAHAMLLHIFSGDLAAAESLADRVKAYIDDKSGGGANLRCVDCKWMGTALDDGKYDHFDGPGKAASDQYNAEISREIGLPLMDGLLAFGRGDYDTAATLLDDALHGGGKAKARALEIFDAINDGLKLEDQVPYPPAINWPFHYIGGSHAQREVFLLLQGHAKGLAEETKQ